MNYSINKNELGSSFELNYPLLSFDENYWMLQELNRCDTDYILNEVLPNIDKIWNGEKYWDPYRSPTYGVFDTFEFGFDATLIDFGNEKSIISHGFGEGSFELNSEEIYCFMKDWESHLKNWKLNNGNPI